jgi:PhnB protein
MKLIHPYLNFNGTCEEAFNFYKSIFGGEFSYLGRFGDMPPQEGRPALPEEAKNLVMHVSLPVSKEITLMGSDTYGEWAPTLVEGNNVQLSITVESREMADNYFGSLSEGGIAKMPMAQTFWGDYFGMCTDKFGINWMISYNETYKFPE